MVIPYINVLLLVDTRIVKLPENMTKNTPDKTRLLCTYGGQNCLLRYVKTRIGQMYCLRCTAESGVKSGDKPLEPIKGTKKYLYKKDINNQ